MRTSLQVLALGGLVLESGQTELWWGRMLRERGNKAEAQQHFQKALSIFEPAGCEHAVSQVKEEFERY